MHSSNKSSNINLLSEENVKKYVLPYYKLENSTISQIKFKNTEKQRAVYKVTNSNGSYCLKKVYFSVKDLLFIYSAVEWLFRNNINVPRFLPTKNGGRFASYCNMLFILTPWIDGEKCNYDNPIHVLKSIENLANIHNIGKDFIAIEGSNIKKDFSTLHHSINKHFLQLLKYSNFAFKYRDKFSKIFLEYFEKNSFLAKTASSIALTINDKNISKSLCHLDYVNKNIIFDYTNDIWVIDFDKCKLDYCVHDISYFLRRFLKRDKTNWNLEITLQCLKLYEKIRPLSIDEYKYIFVYLCFPQKLWRVSKDYYNNINKCNKKSFITIIKKSIKNLSYKLEFIYNFKKYIEDKFNTTLN